MSSRLLKLTPIVHTLINYSKLQLDLNYLNQKIRHEGFSFGYSYTKDLLIEFYFPSMEGLFNWSN